MRLISLIVLTLTLGSLSGESSAASALEGTWKGTTSQGKVISITVQGNQIKNLDLDWSIPLAESCSPSGRTYLRGRDIAISENSFSEVRDGMFSMTFEHFGEDDATLRIQGTFDPKGGVSGQLELTANHCKGKIKLAWSAKKKRDL